MLHQTISYLEARATSSKGAFTYEIIVVDDGSKDQTADVAWEIGRRHGHIRVCQLGRNCGKGYAVRRGFLSARGRKILLADADAATRFADVENLEAALVGSNSIAIGSRAHLQDKAIAERTFLRNGLMHGFHFLVKLLCVRGIRDTQCGFKLFTRQAAHAIFPNLHVDRWAFDVEALYSAQHKGIPIREIAVNWVEIGGSKLNMRGALMMGRDLVRVRLYHTIGLWKM